LKDLIIVRGTNHYPQDLERTAEHNQASYIRAGCSAAFSFKSASSGGEEVAYIAEVKEDVSSQQYWSIMESCKQAITSAHGVSVSSICILKTRSIPKTTSGKIARSWCRRAFLDGSLQIVARWDQGPSDGLVVTEPVVDNEQLSKGDSNSLGQEVDGLMEEFRDNDSQEQIRSLPRLEIRSKLEKALILVTSQSSSPIGTPIDPSVPLNSLGLDSMTLIQYKGLLERKFFCDIPDEFMFTDLATLEELSHAVKCGTMTEKQAKALETGVVDNKAEAIQKRKEPLCPWFMHFSCCYCS
jgi:acyl carrier protein